ncbi:hypothetical protein EMCRGX_G008041 [Ephydatia muelleri]
MSEPTPYARDSSALAFALTRTKLSLPYSVEVACDLEQFSVAARQEARRERWRGDLRDLMTGLNKMGTYYHQTQYLATILRLFGIQLCQGGG